jgi:hypothetical protein
LNKFNWYVGKIERIKAVNEEKYEVVGKRSKKKEECKNGEKYVEIKI